MSAFIGFSASCRTGLRSLQSVCSGGFIKDGADPGKGNPLKKFLHLLKSLFKKEAAAEISSKENRLFDQTKQISGNIINAKADHNGDYSCHVTFGHTRLSVTQSSSDPDNIVIRDIETDETAVLENVSFPELQKQLLVQYIKEQHDLVSLSIDLSAFNLTGINFYGVDFSNTVLSRKNFDAIVAGGGNLAGATLAENADVTNLHIDDVPMDKAMARSIIIAGAHLNSTLWQHFLLHEQAGAKIKVKDDFLQDETAQITMHILNTKQENGNYQCPITIGKKSLTLRQSANSAIEISDPETGEQMAIIQNMTFPELQKQVLVQYMQGQHNLGKLTIDLRPFNLTGINLRGIDFNSALLGRVNFDAIVSGGANLAGATLAAGAYILGLSVEGVALDKTMARSLINAGVDFKSVLKSFLATQPDRLSHRHKATMLTQYLERERQAQRLPIDLSAFNLNDIHFKGVNFHDTLLSQGNLKAIIAGNGNLSGARLAEGADAANLKLDDVGMDKAMAIQLIKAGANPRAVLINYLATERSLGNRNIDVSGIDLTKINLRSIDLSYVNLRGISEIKWAQRPASTEEGEKRVQANFERDLLKMLTVYSQTVEAVLLKSSTLDLVKKDRGKYPIHHQVIKHIRSYDDSDPDMLKSAIKASAGDCHEMAVMSKMMIDLYLKDSLKSLGYQDVSFKSSVLISLNPSDHTVVKLECSFLGVSTKYIIDPWSNGKAWTYADGMDYFRTRKPDRFTQPDIEFENPRQENSDLEGQQYQSAIRVIFDNSRVKEQLDSTIKKNKQHFVGLPVE